jgi:hypothetical protein
MAANGIDAIAQNQNVIEPPPRRDFNTPAPGLESRNAADNWKMRGK